MMVTIDEGSDCDPKGYRLTTEVRVAEPRERVFRFFADAFQLESITPPWLHFTVQSQPPIQMRTGTLIDYKLRLHGIPLRWRSKISNWEPPFQFVDEQVKGPYRQWHHRHVFQEVDRGTLIRDVVHYRVPFGRIVHPLIVRRNLTKIFEFRHNAMLQVFTPMPDVES